MAMDTSFPSMLCFCNATTLPDRWVKIRNGTSGHRSIDGSALFFLFSLVWETKLSLGEWIEWRRCIVWFVVCFFPDSNQWNGRHVLVAHKRAGAAWRAQSFNLLQLISNTNQVWLALFIDGLGAILSIDDDFKSPPFTQWHGRRRRRWRRRRRHRKSKIQRDGEKDGRVGFLVDVVVVCFFVGRKRASEHTTG